MKPINKFETQIIEMLRFVQELNKQIDETPEMSSNPIIFLEHGGRRTYINIMGSPVWDGDAEEVVEFNAKDKEDIIEEINRCFEDIGKIELKVEKSK
jgi:hypothetical protein